MQSLVQVAVFHVTVWVASNTCDSKVQGDAYGLIRNQSTEIAGAAVLKSLPLTLNAPW